MQAREDVSLNAFNFFQRALQCLDERVDTALQPFEEVHLHHADEVEFTLPDASIGIMGQAFVANITRWIEKRELIVVNPVANDSVGRELPAQVYGGINRLRFRAFGKPTDLRH